VGSVDGPGVDSVVMEFWEGEGVGAVVGFLLGERDGSAMSFVDDLDVGSLLLGCDGRDVGLNVRPSPGLVVELGGWLGVLVDWLGLLVGGVIAGASEDFNVGELVGLSVGSFFGKRDGSAMGLIDGLGLGQLVIGGLEGEDVGVAVSLCVGAGVVCGCKMISRLA